jgi:hypothetical protein
MISRLRLLLPTYGLLLLGYAVCLGLVTWQSGILPAEYGSLALLGQRILPFVMIFMMMVLQGALGLRHLRGRTSESTLQNEIASPSIWRMASLLLSFGTWLAFVYLLWWHGFPEDSLGQAFRALLAIFACASVGYFWGRLTASWGFKWCWLAPVAMAAGWVLGQAVCDIFASGSYSISNLKDVPEKSLEKLETIAFLPLMFIGFIALAGTLWNHYRRIRRISCSILIPLMMGPIIWDTVLSNHRQQTIDGVTQPGTAQHRALRENQMVPHTFFNIRTQDYLIWEFPMPEVEEKSNSFLSDTTATLYQKIADWEIPIEFDLALP